MKEAVHPNHIYLTRWAAADTAFLYTNQGAAWYSVFFPPSQFPVVHHCMTSHTTVLGYKNSLVGAVSEIKLFDYAPAGCTPSETVHPGTSVCTLRICSNGKWLKKCAHL